jgi:hypothetical protein
MEQIKKKNRALLNRANLRDTIFVISAASCLMWGIDTTRLCISLLLLLLGSALHFITKGTLIRNVVLCREGTYGIVRHPYYLANYVIDSSLCLLSGNIYLLLIYPLLFFWAYGPTLRQEERILISTHGAAYVRYSLEVAQVLPDGQSIKTWKNMVGAFSKKRITAKEISRLTRFWGMAIFLLLLHDLSKEGLKELIFFYPPMDQDGLLYLGLVLCLFIASFFILRRYKKQAQRKEPMSDAGEA